MRFKVVETPDRSPVALGALLTLSETAELLELNAAELKERSALGDSMSLDGYTFKIVRDTGGWTPDT